jgi:hypothetical protein
MLFETIRYYVRCIYTMITNPTRYQKEQTQVKEALHTLARYSQESKDELTFWKMYYGLD